MSKALPPTMSLHRRSRPRPSSASKGPGDRAGPTQGVSRLLHQSCREGASVWGLVLRTTVGRGLSCCGPVGVTQPHSPAGQLDHSSLRTNEGPAACSPNSQICLDFQSPRQFWKHF